MADNYELARRYSGALFESLPGKAEREKTLSELQALREAFCDVGVRDFFTSPLQTEKEHVAAVKLLTEKVGLSAATANFLDFLLKRQRIDILSQITSAFETANDEAGGVVRGKVTSVRALNEKERDDLNARISKVLNKKLVLEYKVDEALIGGIVAQVGSYKFDDSLDTQLHTLGEALKRRSH